MGENKSPLPKIGKYYHFFDDGKISPNRHYICRVEKILTPEETKNITVVVPQEDKKILYICCMKVCGVSSHD